MPDAPWLVEDKKAVCCGVTRRAHAYIGELETELMRTTKCARRDCAAVPRIGKDCADMCSVVSACRLLSRQEPPEVK